MIDRLLRWVSRVTPGRLKRELPGWGYVELFVQTFASMHPADRLGYLTYALDEGMPYMRMLRRYGVRYSFRAVLGKPSPAIAELFADPPILEMDAVTADDIASNMLMSLNFLDGGASLLSSDGASIGARAPTKRSNDET